jgi:hypothetical protein
MHHRRPSVWFLCLIAAGFVCLVAGCGKGNRATVKGDVTVGGKPADDGSISFTPADGQGPSAGGQIKDGKYQLTIEGLSGAKKVEITVFQKTGKRIAAGPPQPKGMMVDEVKPFTSKETCEITAGQVNQRDFELKPQHK